MKKKFGFWGKFHSFSDEEKPRRIWIGPMTYKEMIQDFPEFRHNWREEKRDEI